MTNRVTAFKAGVLLAGGSTIVTRFSAGVYTSSADAAVRTTRFHAGVFTNDKTTGPRITRYHAGVFADDKTNGPLVTRFHAGVYASDKTNGPRVSEFKIGFWASLDQRLQMGPIAGVSAGVFTPDIRNHIVPVEPVLPELESNPFRAEVPNVDLQQILREQHNVTQAGDSTFPWGVLADVNAEPLYNLGAAGKFFHDDLGIIQARYCKLVDWVETVTAATPVGLRRTPLEPWVVTNRLEKSDPDAVVGVALPYNKSILNGTWYGWVIFDGFVPTELNFEQVDFEVEFDMEYGWSSTGHLKPRMATTSVGKRYSDSKNIRLKPGQFKVEIDSLGKNKLLKIIGTELDTHIAALEGAINRIEDLEAKSKAQAAGIEANSKSINALDKRLVREVRNINAAIRGIRAVLGTTAVTQSYVDVSLETIRAEMVERIKASDLLALKAYETADTALRLASGGAMGSNNLQQQLDNLNAGLGDLTGRLVGFTTDLYSIDNTNPVEEGHQLVAVEAGLNDMGVMTHKFKNQLNSIKNHTDVIATGNPANGQTIVWDAAEGGFKWGNASGGGGGGGGGASRVTPTLVQQVVNRNGGSFALPAPPTAGNLMVLFATGFSSISVYGVAGFFKVGEFQSDANNRVAVWARKVQAGDTGSYTVAGSTDKQAILYEFANAVGVMPVTGGANPFSGTTFSTVIPFAPLTPEGVHMAAVEIDNARVLAVPPTTGWTEDYATPVSSPGNHFAIMGRLDDSFEGTLAGTASGTVSAPVFGVFVVIGDADSAGGGGIGDAPSDGKTYGRKDGEWVEVAPYDPGGLAPAKSWRLRFPSGARNWGGSYMGFAELQFLDVADNVLSTGGIVAASTFINSNWQPPMAFDGIVLGPADNGWLSSAIGSAANHWISYTKATAWKPEKVRLFPPTNHSNSFTRDFVIERSDDGGVSWVLVGVYETMSAGTVGVGQTINL